jgi:hypothetical protein
VRFREKALTAVVAFVGCLGVTCAAAGLPAHAGGAATAKGDILCVAVDEVNAGVCLDNPLPQRVPVFGATVLH